MPLFVLIHSPLVGPASWEPVARELRAAGFGAAVPSLLGVADGEPPAWPRVTAAVAAELTHASPKQPVILVAHSNAGVFVPVIASELEQQVICSVFADASVPAAADHLPVTEEEFLPFLRGLAGEDGLLPPWTQWWDETEVARILPDPQVRATVTSEEPRLPLRYFTEQVPVPAGWDDHQCAYLLFSEGYRDEAAKARERGWPVQSVPGGHLHQLTEPGRVAHALIALALPGPP